MDHDVWVVGEAKVRLDLPTGKKRGKTVFNPLQSKVDAVRAEHGAVEVVPALVAHMATPEFLSEAERRGFVVIQSFKW